MPCSFTSIILLTSLCRLLRGRHSAGAAGRVHRGDVPPSPQQARGGPAVAVPLRAVRQGVQVQEGTLGAHEVRVWRHAAVRV